jgi:tetratricopeptide (TPR) repeat protein
MVRLMVGRLGARRSFGRAARFIAAAAIALGGVRAAAAQPAPDREGQRRAAPGGKEDKKEALRRLASGDKKLQRGDRLNGRGHIEQAYAQYEAALIDYQAAYHAYADPQILYPIAQAEQRLGRFLDALQHYQELLAESKALSPALREQVQIHLDEVRKNLAAVVLEIEPDGAEISVDGKSVGRSPLRQPVFLEPGQHTYRVSLEGHRTEEERVDLAAGKELRKRVRLQSKAPPKKPPRRPKPPVARAERPSAAPVWIGVGVTGALLAGGAATGFAAVSRHNVYDDEQRSSSAREAAREDGKRFALATDILLGASLVAAGATAYYYFAIYRPRSAEANQADARAGQRERAFLRVEPVVGGGVAGLAVSGSFW